MSTGRASSNAAKIAYLGSWVVFCAVIMAMEGWSDAAPLYLFIAFMGFVGLITAVMWILRGTNWIYGALASSLAVLIAYGLWWAVDIGTRYEADPHPGLLRTITVQVEIWLSLARGLIGRSHYLYAFCQLYWGILMPLIQLAFLPSLLGSLRSLRARAAGPIAA